MEDILLKRTFIASKVREILKLAEMIEQVTRRENNSESKKGL